MTPLDLPGPERAALADAVLALVDRFLDGRPAAPASSPWPDAALMQRLLEPPPAEGRPVAEVLAAVEAALPPGLDTSSGGHLSYIPSGGVPTAAFGALIGAVTNQYTGGAHAAPGPIAMEESVVAWMAEVVGLPAGAGGLLLSGGSMANLTATVAARTRLGAEHRDGVLYASERAHHSVTKAARIAGIADDRIRLVATDDRQRLDVAALGAAMAADVAAGLRPMMVAATAGTTDTGAIDPLAACTEIAHAYGAWSHVDAAYGGFFALTARGRARLAGLGMADSVTVDAHKSLLLPFGIGGLLVRDRADLAAAFAGSGAYMQDLQEEALPHYFALGPELTRPNRGLPVWLALHVHGTAAFAAVLDEMLDLAARTADRLTALDGIEVLSAPALSVVAFRATAGDDATLAVLDHVNASHEVHLSSTTVDGRVHVRVAFLSQRTTTAIADRVVELVAEAVA